MSDSTRGVLGPILYSGEPHTLKPSIEDKKSLCVRDSDESVFKVLPDGTPAYSPKGSDGAYERCTVDGDVLIFAYNDDPNSHPDKKSRSHVHIVSWRGNLPVLS